MWGEKQRSQPSLGRCSWWQPSWYCHSEGTGWSDRGTSPLLVKSGLRWWLRTAVTTGRLVPASLLGKTTFANFQTLPSMMYFHWRCKSHRSLLYCTMSSYLHIVMSEDGSSNLTADFFRAIPSPLKPHCCLAKQYFLWLSPALMCH